MPNFNDQLALLRNNLVAQGDRVLDITLKAVESYFDGDREKARAVIAADEEVDRVDVEIERASIPLLAMGVTDEKSIRSVLTIVKVNNELERVADCAVDIAEAVLSDVQLPARIPDVFRVMANSVIGMLRDTNRAFAAGNTSLAQQVLLFDDTVASFKTQLLRTAQEQFAEVGELLLADAEPFVGQVAIPRDPAAAEDLGRRAARPQAGDRPRHLLLVERHQRVAVAFLVAAGDQRVERERILVGRGLALLDEHAEHAPLVGVERPDAPGRLGFGVHLAASCAGIVPHVP